MASLTKDKRTGLFVIQWTENKRRKTITLPSTKYRQNTAEQVKEMVETLIYHRDNGILVPDKTVAKRLGLISGELQEKLAKVGLIAVTKLRTCKELWDTFLKHKTGVKPNTTKCYQQSQQKFLEAFSPTEPIDNITVERLLEWKASLLAKHKEATVAGHIKNVKAVLNWAVDTMDWLPKNPLRRIAGGSFRNAANDRPISMEEYAKLLDACPNQEWRTIIALARIGGLRCPSELKRLRWTDINWAENRFLVRSPKTERHEGHRERIVPLFPALRVELDRLFFSLDETDENEFVIEHYQRTYWNVYTPFEKIANLAGLGTIVCPFVNMRRSRSNEVEREFGSKKESLWIGHSEKVMVKHYLVLEDDDYAEAAGMPMDGQKPHAELHANSTVQDSVLRCN